MTCELYGLAVEAENKGVLSATEFIDSAINVEAKLVRFRLDGSLRREHGA